MRVTRRIVIDRAGFAANASLMGFEVGDQQVERHDLKQVGHVTVPENPLEAVAAVRGGHDQIRMQRRP